MKTIRMTTAQAVVEFLKNQYVERDGKKSRIVTGVMGIFGHGNVAGLGQALNERAGNDLPFYQAKNEQAMVHTAIAYAKTKKRLGLMACTTSIGPGATNLVTGAATATINRIPVLLFPGDIFSSRSPDPVLQQLEHPQSMDISVNDCLKPVSKYWDRIHRPEQILKALPEAMRILMDPAETGAVTICMPQDVQAEAFDFPEAFFAPRTIKQYRQNLSEEALTEATSWIRQSERPFMVVGGGVHFSDAEAALDDLCKATGIPAAFTQAGTGSLLAKHAQSMGSLGVTGTSAANTLAENADLVICVGTRLSDFTTASNSIFKNKKARFIHLNINAHDANKLGALPLSGDAREGLLALRTKLKSFVVSSMYAKEVAAAKSNWKKTLEKTVSEVSPSGLISQARVIHELNSYFEQSNSVVVHAAGGIPGDIHKLWQAQSTTDYHSEYGYSCMGYEIAGAIGVKMAEPKKRVFAFLGDGSYLMLNQEIVTAVQENISITIVLNDNHGYRCIQNLQESCGGDNFGNEFRNKKGEVLQIDFMANAKSLGANVWLAKTQTELQLALRESESHDGVSFIYIPVATDLRVPGFAWWDVPVSEVSSRSTTQKKRQEYELKKKDQLYVPHN